MSNSKHPSRSQTPSRSPVPPPVPPPIPNEQQEGEQKPQRKSSFGFLKRGKSVEKMNGNNVSRSVSNGKLRKKGKQMPPEPVPIPAEAPMIPNIPTAPKLQEFGGENARAPSTTPYNIPIPRVPKALEEAYSRSNSVTNRGRYSYASSAVSTLNSPRRVRRRKDATPFNILVVGARNAGKTAFGEFLRSSLVLPARKQRPSYYPHDDEQPIPTYKSPNFTSEFIETEIGGERIGLTIWDSEGLEKSSVDLQLRDIIYFIESKFAETLSEETKVIRSPGVKDTHIHCVVLLLDPTNLNKTVTKAKKQQEVNSNTSQANGRSFLTDVSPETIGALDEDMDLQVLRALQGKTTVIPIISKADTITTEQMKFLKRSVYKQLKSSKLDPFEVLGMEESEHEDDSEVDSDAEPSYPRHNHKRLNEADEDEYRAQRGAKGSHLDLSDSSSADSSVIHLGNGGASSSKQSSDALPPLPLSVLTPDPIVAHDPTIGTTSREFPWGSADPYDPKHCDFVRFKEAVFQEWFAELREASRELWYEGWRTSRLNAPRTRSGTANTQYREPTIPVLTPEPKVKPTAISVSAAAPTQAAGNTTTGSIRGGYSFIPPTQPNRSPRSPNFPQLPLQQQPVELSAGSPQIPQRGSPQPNQRISPQPSNSKLNQQHSQIHAQQHAQQLFQQQYQQQQAVYAQYHTQRPAHNQQQQMPARGQAMEEVGVAR